MGTVTEAVCPTCSGRTWQPWRAAGSGGPWRYVRCARCGLVRVDPFPTSEQLAGVFDEGYFVDGAGRGGYVDYDADAELHRVNAAARLEHLPSPVGTSDSVPVLVDVGCASGYTLDEAARRGWTAVGVEVSAEAAQRARDKGHRVEASLEALADLAGRVDAVCFFQVLEHLPDPVAALREARLLLRPGGVVLCETWDGASLVSRLSGRRWQQLSPPSVLWVLDRPSARGMLTASGMELQSWRRTSKVVSLALVLGQLGVASSSTADLPARLTGLRVRYGLGDLVMLQARTGPGPASR